MCVADRASRDEPRPTDVYTAVTDAWANATNASPPTSQPVYAPDSDRSSWYNLTLPNSAWEYEARATSSDGMHRLYLHNLPFISPEAYVQALTDLLTWADANNLIVRLYESGGVGGLGYYCPYMVRVYTSHRMERSSERGQRRLTAADLGTVECGLCNATHEQWRQYCPATGQAPRCGTTTCLRDRGYGRYDEVFLEEGLVRCAVCSPGTCAAEHCARRIGSEWAYCGVHAYVRAYCPGCRSRLQAITESEALDNYTLIDETWFCNDCEGNVCRGCTDVPDYGGVTLNDDGVPYCSDCITQSATESLADDDTVSNTNLRLRTIPGREMIRRCGIEIEGGRGSGNGRSLARALHTAGLSHSSEVQGYHRGSDGGFAHVENDASVDWELVIGPVNMAETNDVRQLNQTVRMVRDMVHDGTLKLDLRCGLHIHVGAERVGMDGAFRLNRLFAYLEDPIFRLAAARWPMHRACSGSDYATPVDKRAQNPGQFGRSVEGNRYAALSFQNYINAMLARCSCGASRYDDWANCTCPDLGKCTFEFRVFNSTANPRKLHAYLSLTQALVAKALSMPDFTNDELPFMEFRASTFKEMGPSAQSAMVEMWEPRVRWMFNELPLTDFEKESLLYCVKNSELAALGEPVLSSLISEEVPA
jgi:hypothetical protein